MRDCCLGVSHQLPSGLVARCVLLILGFSGIAGCSYDWKGTAAQGVNDGVSGGTPDSGVPDSNSPAVEAGQTSASGNGAGPDSGAGGAGSGVAGAGGGAGMSAPQAGVGGIEIPVAGRTASAGTGASGSGDAPAGMGGGAAGDPSNGGTGAAGVGDVDAGASGTGGSGSDAGPSPEVCATENSLRCGQAVGQREICQGGIWVSAKACATGEVCSASSGGICKSAPAVCQGNAGKAVCDADGGLYVCDADGSVASQEMCMSQAHCQKGLATRTCALCVPGEYKCSGAALQGCSDDGQSYKTEDTCDTAALCNADAHACTAATCSPNKTICQGDMLRTCNSDGTAFASTKTCGRGLCDQAAQECDICTPGQKTCDNNTVRTCSANGQGYDTTSCTGAKPKCVGTGQCVECAADTPCPASTQTCKVNSCNLFTNTCGLSNAMSGTGCSTSTGQSGACDGSGACVECLNENDGRCGGSTPHCNSAHKCVQCTSNSHCNPVSEKCVLGECKPKCGDGIIDEQEDCERGLQGWNDTNCNFSTCRRTVYQSCYNQGQVCSTPGTCLAGWFCVAISDSNCVTSCPKMPGFTSRCSSGICYLACGSTASTGCPWDMVCQRNVADPGGSGTVDMCFGRQDL